MPVTRPRHPDRRRPPGRHRPPAAVLACLTVLVIAGCSDVSGGDPAGNGLLPPASTAHTAASSSTAHVAAGIADRLTGDGAATVRPPDTRDLDTRLDPHGPEHAAVALILDGLAAEGLLVTSIDTEVVVADGQHATVVVTAAHSPGHGHPTQSRYELHLTRSGDGWTLTGHREQR